MSETLVIPVAVLKKAQALGTPRLLFRRTFSNASAAVPVQVEIVLTTEALADFKITGIRLRFANSKPEITVKRNQPLKAYADITFSGSGLLQGRWEVDGRVVSVVTRHLVQRTAVTLETPEGQPLPAAFAGEHRVRFVVSGPPSGLPIPEAVYFVLAEEFRGVSAATLLSPQNGSEIDDHQAAVFRWTRSEGVEVYRIEFYEDTGGIAFFSAFVRAAQYRLPPASIQRTFSPGRAYRWKVLGYNAEGQAVLESPVFRFHFRN